VNKFIMFWFAMGLYLFSFGYGIMRTKNQKNLQLYEVIMFFFFLAVAMEAFFKHEVSIASSIAGVGLFHFLGTGISKQKND